MSRVLVSGEVRASLVRMDSETPYLQATVVELPDDEVVSGEREEDDPMNREAMIRGLQDVFKEYLLKNPKLSKELGSAFGRDVFLMYQIEGKVKIADKLTHEIYPFLIVVTG
mgnify:CR=1 FL=1